MDLLARSKQHAYSIAHTFFVGARCASCAYYIFIPRDINNLQSDWRCQHSGRAHEKCAYYYTRRVFTNYARRQNTRAPPNIKNTYGPLDYLGPRAYQVQSSKFMLCPFRDYNKIIIQNLKINKLNKRFTSIHTYT